MSCNDIFDNHLYDNHYFTHEILTDLPRVADAGAIFAALDAILAEISDDDSEANLDMNVAARLLKLLGWPFAYQQRFKFHGNKKIPDFLLFATEEDRTAFLAAPRDDKPLNLVCSIWEDKAENVPLDNGKTGAANPYFQLMDYLLPLHLRFGFLSNGRELRYVDNSDFFSSKRYLAVNLPALAASRDVNALRIFLGIFGRQAQIAEPGAEPPAVQLAAASRKRTKLSETELATAIYGLNGKDSLFEQCGSFLYAARHGEVSLEELYKNCLYFTFRLIFIAFLEDKHKAALLRHPGYKRISLAAIYQRAAEAVAAGFNAGYEIWDELQQLFRILDEGNANLGIPLFNGGLFAKSVASMLDAPKMLTNEQTYWLLAALYGEDSGRLRDFSSISVIQLGRIYESLLEFEFRIADETLWYFEYRKRQKGKMESITGYYDTEDYENIKNQKGCRISGPVKKYNKGEVYLTGGKNSRKQSASYYTPQSLSKPLVRTALNDIVSRLPQGESLLNVKILDNACGSGHLLVEALQYLTHLALGRLDQDTRLKDVLADEKRRIDQTLEQMGLAQYGIAADELAVLKRILLKRTIYGVDVQPFAVELTKLSLWIETFVFGTPLSFIEHHIRTGNALTGCPLERVQGMLEGCHNVQGLLQGQHITDAFRALDDVFQTLNALQDTTAADITGSKAIFREKIKPRLEELNNYFDLLNAADMLVAEGTARQKLVAESENTEVKKKELLAILADLRRGAKILNNYEEWAQALHSRTGAWQETEKLIVTMREKYRFFNWEREFPEVFAVKNGGFHLIIGNPPWDKTKFADPDFFSQYRSNYRQLSNKEKLRVSQELLAKPHIRERYAEQRLDILTTNEYYKLHFPCSRGAGDGNLFRFFVENNLRLLRPGGTLNYILPTALWTDEGSTTLRELILDKYWLRYFYGFENRAKLFPDVDSRYKFGLMQVEKPLKAMPPESKTASARFMLTSPGQLQDTGANFPYTMTDIRETSPRWLALMEVRSRRELDLMVKIHNSGFACLSPAYVDFRNELHATADRKIFHERYAEGMLPLYSGACIWQYDSQYWQRAGEENKNEYWLKTAEFDAHLLKKERGRLIDGIYVQLNYSGKKTKRKVVLDALKLKKESELDQFIKPDRLFPRLAFRAIASDTNERTMIAAVIPAEVGAQNSLWVSIPKRYALCEGSVTVEIMPLEQLFFIQALFNSLIFDWVLRCSVAINVNKTYIWRVPMPQPDAAAIRSDEIFMRLTRNSLRLSCYYNEAAFAPLWGQFGLSVQDAVNTAKMASMVRRENDLLVARLYGLNKADMEVMLQGFAVMNGNYPGYGAALLEEMG